MTRFPGPESSGPPEAGVPTAPNPVDHPVGLCTLDEDD
jgi:hypothetical protein